MEESAVEWLVNEFKDTILKEYGESRFLELIEQAKEMEKQQIIDAYDKATDDYIYNYPLESDKYYKAKLGKYYYNETFKSE